ncbi:MAG: 16S rRNA (guanine(966)-N(2))-methyltransferase RsmD [Candidatus Hydrothermales bacterium]
MSYVRIIGGFLKGKRIYVPSSIRATQEKFKKALFDILGDSVKEALFLDLFAGSGNVGIEAVSRGAKLVFFVEKSPTCIKAIVKNVKELNIEDKVRIIKSDVLTFLRKNKEIFDIIFADPPYNFKIRRDLIENILKILNTKKGILIFEVSKRSKLNNIREMIKREETYGESKILFFGNLSGKL